MVRRWHARLKAMGRHAHANGSLPAAIGDEPTSPSGQVETIGAWSRLVRLRKKAAVKQGGLTLAVDATNGHSTR